MSVSLADLSPADLANLFSQMKAAEKAEREALKVEREAKRAFVGQLVGIIGQKFPERTMTSGAVGWSLGGKDVEVPVKDAEGTVVGTRKARVSILIRWEDTIPASDTSTTEE